MSLSHSGVIRHFRVVSVLALAIILFQTITVGEPVTSEASKSLPANLGEFRQTGPVKVWRGTAISAPATPILKGRFGLIYTANAEYLSPNGEKLTVDLVKFENESAAYSRFTFMRKMIHEHVSTSTTQSPVVGTASVTSLDGVLFFKGVNVVSVESVSGKDPSKPIALARLLADSIKLNEPDVPVLVKHLPNWETAESDSVYFVEKTDFTEALYKEPILQEISFEGAPEAVIANYGHSQLVIVEFTTPQFSIDNDQRIQAKIAELKSKGDRVPSAYRRVGNYSVFVFYADDEKSANALIDQVKYEQVVQWLGDDPYLYQRLQKYFAQTSAGVLVAVLKSSGLSLLFCLAAGALIGTMLFRHRRAQRASLYSDAGGSVRLNLDDLTAPTKQRLLPTPKIHDSANP